MRTRLLLYIHVCVATIYFAELFWNKADRQSNGDLNVNSISLYDLWSQHVLQFYNLANNVLQTRRNVNNG